MLYIFEIEVLKMIRESILNQIKDLTLEQIYQVAKGHNNNIFWNFMHLLVTQQILCYKLASQPIKIEGLYWNFIKKEQFLKKPL